MANPHRGSVALQAGDKSYTLSFSINALCELEDAMGKPVTEIATSLAKDHRLSTVRTLVWAALRDHHQDIEVNQAGEIIGEAGMPACMEATGKAFALAFPDQAEAKGKANPRKAAKA